MKQLWQCREALAFCLVYAFSFALMGEVVKSVDPITSTLITYGLTGLFFLLLNSKHFSDLWRSVLTYRNLLLIINVTTLANTVLAFLVMTYVSPLVYVTVFFGSLPIMKDITVFERYVLKTSAFWLNGAVLIGALTIAALTSASSNSETMKGLGLTLLSSYFAAMYMQKSAEFHKQSGLNSSQLLSLRFFLVIVVCGAYSLFQHDNASLNQTDLIMLVGTAISGSIIPLFLMQRSIVRLGVRRTVQWMPMLPLMCMVILSALGLELFTAWQILAVFVFSILLFLQTRLKA
ncbi:hypothetical protein [uncultured Deefgea sp.]|uniref:hypothetical protein n=1 Tax=uncultured Deefgea sp. TaxID=1304914 RepID=UPI00260D5F65|nr:hypothetical protein [uncultured Deefgea sp.]